MTPDVSFGPLFSVAAQSNPLMLSKDRQNLSKWLIKTKKKKQTYLGPKQCQTLSKLGMVGAAE